MTSTLPDNVSKLSLAPSYQTLDPTNPTPGESFQVGKSRVSFVKPDQLRRHLILLSSFSRLRRIVESSSSTTIGSPFPIEDPRAKWTVFVTMAVYRYELYLKEIVAAGNGMVPLPPIDVAMVHHTHLLNPTNFAEDKLRIYPELELLSDRLLTQFVDSIDPQTFEHESTEEERSIWTNRTQTLYDPMENFAKSQGRTIVCPKTGNEIFVPWIDSTGTGFAQQGFKVQGGSPDFTITHEKLGIAKFAKDLFAMRDDERKGLANTVLNAHNALTTEPSLMAGMIHSKLSIHPWIKSASNWQEIGERLQWKREEAYKIVAHGVGGTKQIRKINDILEGYSNGSPFSLDLSMATLRQATFIEKMSSLGWLSSEWINNEKNNETLYRCVARYHAFMDIISNHQSLLAVPTLDIDLAWHTHQLTSQYRIDTAKAVGSAVDHNDKVEETDLGYGFDDTAKFWEEKYRVPYHQCGCPHPPVSAADKARAKLTSSKFGAKLGLGGSSSSSSSNSATATIDETDLEQTPHESLSTHSSEHNSIVLAHHPDAQRRRQSRMDEFGDRKKKQDKKKKSSSSSQEDHDLFFLSPVPMWDHYGTEGYPSSREDIVINANQAGTNDPKGSCGGSAGQCAAGSVGSCGAASGVYLVGSPTAGGLPGSAKYVGFMTASAGAGGAF